MPHIMYLATIIARPNYFIGGGDGGACGSLISERTSSTGMSGSGWTTSTYASSATADGSGGYSIPVPSEGWFMTAKSGSFSGAGDTTSGCARFRYSNSGGGTVTWTPSVAGTHAIEVGHASGSGQVIKWKACKRRHVRSNRRDAVCEHTSCEPSPPHALRAMHGRCFLRSFCDVHANCRSFSFTTTAAALAFAYATATHITAAAIVASVPTWDVLALALATVELRVAVHTRRI